MGFFSVERLTRVCNHAAAFKVVATKSTCYKLMLVTGGAAVVPVRLERVGRHNGNRARHALPHAAGQGRAALGWCP